MSNDTAEKRSPNNSYVYYIILLFRIFPALADIDPILFEDFANSVTIDAYDGSNFFWRLYLGV